MKTALIYGTTGLIGSHLLELLLASDHYDRVIALSRRPLDTKHKKLVEIIHDFDHPENDQLVADHVFCCMGTTMKKAGNTEKYRRIDHDYVVETAKAAFQNGATLFSLVSAVGANTKSRIFYNKLKGEVEESIRKIGFKGLHIFRPSLLLGERNEFRFFERLAQITMKGLNFLVPIKSRAVKANKVAEVMAAYAAKLPGEERIVTNETIIRN